MKTTTYLFISLIICLGLLFNTSCQKEEQEVNDTEEVADTTDTSDDDTDTVDDTDDTDDTEDTTNTDDGDTTDTGNDDSVPLALTLTSDKERIKLGEEAVITASVTGGADDVTYNWSINTSLALMGSGSEVTLFASCYSCIGENEITCKVTDGNDDSVTKKITVTVLE